MATNQSSIEQKTKPRLDSDKVKLFSLGFKRATGGLSDKESTQLAAMRRRLQLNSEMPDKD
jgi:ribosomal protein L29